jgi:hypothetical protein
LLLAGSAGIPLVTAQEVSARESWDRQIRPLIASSCEDCHTGVDAGGGLDFEAFQTVEQVVDQRRLWKKIRDRVRDHQMPPADAEALPDDLRKRLVDWIDHELPSIACHHLQHAGPVTIRRLTRLEYANTVRDLLGVDFDPNADFPVDESGYGFDNIGDVLSVSPLLLEKYLAAAEAISERLIEDAGRFRVEKTFPASELETVEGSYVVEGGQLLSTTGTLSLPCPVTRAGRYRITVEAWGQQAGEEDCEMAVSVDGRILKQFEVGVDRENPRAYSLQTRIEASAREIQVTFVNDYYNPGAADRNRRDRNLGVNWIHIEGPLDRQTVSPAQANFLFATPNRELSGEEAARKVITRHGARAFRRPLSPDEIEQLLAMYRLGTEQGEDFFGAMRLVVQAMLVSPHFLFKVESPPPGDGSAQRLDPYELATALSYFLWGTMPDDHLFRRAAHGELSDPRVLGEEVERLLADDRSWNLVGNFGTQWLQLRVLERFDPDPERFAAFTPTLRAAMIRETQLLLDEVIRRDAPLSQLLNSQHTWVNRLLARHYGMPEGALVDDVFERVEVAGSRRGGLLTQASFLALTSNPTRTSPVKRGKWVLENLLADPPPPALPNVPQLDSQHQLTGSLRQRMEQHRADPNCAVCHYKMDSIGFALENFDAIGRFRTEDDGLPIDASGQLPGDRSFDGAEELQQLIIADEYDAYVRCFVQKLFTFALGRGPTASDDCIIDAITRDVIAGDKRVSGIIQDIVASEPFLCRSSSRPSSGEPDEPDGETAEAKANSGGGH